MSNVQTITKSSRDYKIFLKDNCVVKNVRMTVLWAAIGDFTHATIFVTPA